MMDDELRQVLEGMQRDNAAAHVETRRHFDIVAEASDTSCGSSRKADHLDTRITRLEAASQRR